jgi:hypothetical protein
MLERPTLLLLPWSDGQAPSRSIADAESGARVGSVRWRRRPGPGWRSWFAPPVLEVREAGDEPLLCTLQRY